MIYLSLGSNLGHRLFNLRKAINCLKKIGFLIKAQSIILETPAILPPNAPSQWNKPYLNLVIAGETNLSPHDLLDQIQKIEQNLGRPNLHPKWSLRTIDIDILLWKEETINSPLLTIPHPEIRNRAFLLHLLAMLIPDFCLPDHANYKKLTLGTLAHQRLVKPCFTKSFVLNPQLVGVVNVTPDSFSDGGAYLNPQTAISHILKLQAEGATIIEIGAQSTRPNAEIIPAKTEYERLAPVLEGVKEQLDRKEILLSLDSFSPDTILNVLQRYPIAWVNDVKGNLSPAILSKIAAYDCSFVAMHNVSIPPNCKDIITHPSLIQAWAKNTYEQLKKCGFQENHIILDPGIGFGKSAYQSLWLLKQIRDLKKLPCAILVGHSRKSYINAFFPSKPNERDLETLAISNTLSEAGIDYLRVHDVAMHQRFFVAKQSVTTQPKEQ